MGHQKSFSTVQDDDFEFDEAYFRQFYKPLSNLPTPPPSSRNSSASPQSSCFSADDRENLNTEFLGPAAHLARMLPPGASFMTPSFTIVQEILVNADLPMDVIALAVCILDSLTWKFSRSWRSSFPLHGPAQDRRTSSSSPHIDSIFPEVIVLGALIIASKFTEDMQESTQYFSKAWGRGLWTCEQINFTERCIMESLGYRILPLWNTKYIKQARHDIEMARRELFDEDPLPPSKDKDGWNAKHAKSKSECHPNVGLGLQLTPQETPTSEVASPFGDGQHGHGRALDQETREAFGKMEALPDGYLHLPGEATLR